jgi:hypothetical protein
MIPSRSRKTWSVIWAAPSSPLYRNSKVNAPWAASQPPPCQPGLRGWWLLAGVFIGFLFLLGMQLKLQWFAFLFLGSLVLIASQVAADKKTYFLVLFVLALPVWIGKHLDFHPSPYGISTFGFPIHVSLLPLTALYVIWAVRQVVGDAPAPLSTRGLLPLAGVFAAAAVSVLGSTDQRFAALPWVSISSVLTRSYTVMWAWKLSPG